MVSLVHDSGWSREPSWPSTVAEGDLAVVARRWTSVSGVGYPNPSPGPQWVGLGNYGTRTGATHWRAELFWWQVRGTSRPPIGPGSNFTSFRLLIFRGTAGIGRARTGRALVPVSENGGAIAIGVEASTAGDLTILPGSGTVQVGWGAASSDGVFGNSGWNHSHTRIYELLPPAGPLAPLVLAPGDGAEVSSAEPVAFEWQHRPSVAGGRQDAYQLRAWDDESDPAYWNASTGAWTSGEVTNQSAVQGVAVPAAAFTVNVPMSWQVRTREGVDGRWSAWSSAASFMPVTPPSVSVTSPEDLHDDLSPLVAWDATTPRGEQSAFRVQIAQLGTILYDSGSQPGDDDEWQVPAQDWSNGALYQARVQVQQTGGSWSSWDTRDFTISWTEPAVPAVEVSAGVDGVEVSIADAAVADARATLEAVLGEEPVYSPDAPADTSRAWYNAGEVRRWVDTFGPEPVTNLVTNPRGKQVTPGSTVLRRNLAQNPRAALSTGWTSNNSARWQRSLVTVDDHPLGITTATEWSTVGTEGHQGHVASGYNIDDLANTSGIERGAGVWIKVNAPGYEGRVGTTSSEWVPLPENEWTFVTGTQMVPGTSYMLAAVRRIDGGSVPAGHRAWMTGAIATPGAIPTGYFDGDTPDEHGWVYEWEGTPGASASVAKAGAVTIRENLIPNPSFETGTSGVVSGSATTIVQTSFGSAIASGTRALHATVTGANASNGYVAQSVDLPEDSEGMWLGVSLVARRSGPGVSGAQIYVDFRDGSGSAFLNYTSDHWLLPDAPATEVPRRDFAVQIPAGAVTSQVWLRMRGDSPGAAPGDGAVHTDAWMAAIGRSETEALAAVQNYFDGDTSPDPDFTPEWDGTPGESTSRLVAPSPVGWTLNQGYGAIYYSETHDAVAVRPAPFVGWTYGRVRVDAQDGPTTMSMWVLNPNDEELVTRPMLQGGSSTYWILQPGENYRTVTQPMSGTDFYFPRWSQTDYWPVGKTIYVRANLVPGEYTGPYFDGDDFGVYWNGDPHDSTSTYPGPHWAPVEDAEVVDAAQALHAVEDSGISIDLERITSEGLWVPVGAFQMPPAGAVTVTDVRAPYGQTVAYRARAVNELEGQRLTSEWGLSGQVASQCRWSYLFAAGAPLTTWRRVLIREDGVHTYQRPTAVAYGLGDRRARVSYAPERGRTGTLTLHALTQEEREGLTGLLHAGEPLGLRLPAEAHLDGPGYRDGGELIFNVADEVQSARVATGPWQQRQLTVSWVEQDAPAPSGGTAAPITHPIGQE